MTIESLIEKLSAPEAPSLYRTYWQGERNFSKLPHMTWETFVAAPLSDRLYSKEPYLTSVIERDGKRAVWAKTLSSIEQESYGKIGERPLVAAADLSRNVEFGTWCYGQGVLPLSAEQNPTVTAALAKRYGIDSVILTKDALPSLATLFARDSSPSTFRAIVLTGYAFGEYVTSFIRGNAKNTSVSLSLPETGVIAHACKDRLVSDLVFHAPESVRCETETTLVVTKLALLPIPIVRYDTGIHVRSLPAPCSCGKNGFTLTS